jgi:sirohydrochlorin ferrochelatase
MTNPSAILLVDHGSRVESANRLIENVAEAIRERRPESVVEFAHMEIASPSIAEGISACVAAGARSIDLHPYFLAAGRHTRESIPALVEKALEKHPGLEVRISDPLGFHPRIIEVVLERIEALE